MQGDIVKAAKWLGGCMVAASLILVLGFHPTVTGRVVTFTKVQPEAPSIPTAPNQTYPTAIAPAGYVPVPPSPFQAIPCCPPEATVVPSTN
jgi:hypothetical protein